MDYIYITYKTNKEEQAMKRDVTVAINNQIAIPTHNAKTCQSQ